MHYEKRPPNAAHYPDLKHYLTAVQLRERYGGRSEMWIERIMQRDAKFPRPIYIGRLRFWALDEIEAYERAAVAVGSASADAIPITRKTAPTIGG
jgi:predicted DNA-binding transcriptional regulator AlpA